MKFLDRFRPQPDLIAAPMLRDVTAILALIQAAEGKPEALKECYLGLKSFEDQSSFLSFLCDTEIIEAGIAKDVPELVRMFPNLRY